MRGPSFSRRGALALALLLAVGAGAAQEPPADLALTGGAVYTVDAARSWASAVAVRDGRIVYVGSDAGVRRFVGERTRVVPLAGRMLLPGFQDAHVHPVSGGLELGQCDLNGLASREAVIAKVRDCAAAQRGEWLVGGGWALPLFPNADPGRELLDECLISSFLMMTLCRPWTRHVNFTAPRMAKSWLTNYFLIFHSVIRQPWPMQLSARSRSHD